MTFLNNLLTPVFPVPPWFNLLYAFEPPTHLFYAIAVSTRVILPSILVLLSAHAVGDQLVDRLLSDKPVPPPEKPTADNDTKPAPPIDLNKPVVSRGFGVGAEAAGDSAARRDLNAGLVAFFFKNYTRAYQLWKHLAGQGNAEAQAKLGWMFQTGAGVPQDHQQAFAWYQKAAEQGHAVAQNNLGVMYEKGWGVELDYSKAARWYQASAQQGYRYAQFNLGVLYADGKRGKDKTAEGAEWLRRAAEQGVKEARARLEGAKPQ